MTDDRAWMARWLDSVMSGDAAMSQRTTASIEAHGGIAVAVEAARARGVHLLELTGDDGKPLVAASRSLFRTLC